MQMESKLLELKKEVRYSNDGIPKGALPTKKQQLLSLLRSRQSPIPTPRAYFSSRKKSPRTSAFKQGKIQYQSQKNRKIRFP